MLSETLTDEKWLVFFIFTVRMFILILKQKNLNSKRFNLRKQIKNRYSYWKLNN